MTKKTMLKILLLFLASGLYVGAVIICNASAQYLHFGVAALKKVHTAWLIEAPPWLVACVLSSMIPRLVLILQRRQTQLCVLAALSFIVIAWLVTQPASYSLDILRYLWDGRLINHGVNPYQYTPIDPQLSAFRDRPYWGMMAWKNWPEAYPPLAQMYFAVFSYLGHGTVIGYKILLLFNALASVLLFYMVLAKRRIVDSGADRAQCGSDHARSRRSFFDMMNKLTPQDVRRFGLFVLFPPLLIESYGAGHVDVLAIPWLLFAWLCVLRNRWGWMGFAIAMATDIKVYPMVLLAALWNKQDIRGILKSLAVFFLTIALLYVPFLSAGSNMFTYFHHVARLGYNGSLQYLLEHQLPNSFFAQKPTVLVFIIELMGWGMILFTKAYYLPMEHKACLLGLCFMLASPVVHSWYLIVLIPFAVMIQERATLWFAVTIHFTYDEIPYDMFVEYIPTYWWFFRGWVKRRPGTFGTGNCMLSTDRQDE